ncbi:MAG: ATP-dependent zinc protease [Candidatus Colwellbacteria bacterium]|nr:ATP-dependent zinc protease [Candidatus Colwellbacteria bacterium]
MNIFGFFAGMRRVLGMNERNLSYIARFNTPRGILLARDKLETKALLEKAGLPFPRTLFTVSRWSWVKEIPWASLPLSFVIKPARSSQGKGVLVIFGKSKRKEDMWIRSDGKLISLLEIETHLFNILEGAFSGESGDEAFFEERVKIHPSLKPYARRGTPDIRVIVFNHVPVMAELRLPTLRSEGRSNLHMGGIGVGIDLALGITTHAIWMGKMIRFIPSTRVLLSGVAIPHWDKVLLLAVRSLEALDLGFAGVDIGITPEGNSLVFEVNAKPGLAIQNANLSGLREHLERVKGLAIKNTQQGVALAQALFGGDVTKQLEYVSGKKVVGAFEPIEIQTPRGPWPITAKLDTGAYSTSIDQTLLKKLGIAKTSVYRKKVKSALGAQSRSFVELTFFLKGEKIATEVNVSQRTESRYEVLIGRKDLKGFLIDPSRKKTKVV